MEQRDSRAESPPAGSTDGTGPVSAVAEEAARGKQGRSVTAATHAGLKSHKQRYGGIWGS